MMTRVIASLYTQRHERNSTKSFEVEKQIENKTFVETSDSKRIL